MDFNSDLASSKAVEPLSPFRDKNYKHNVINQTSFFSVTVSQNEQDEQPRVHLKAKIAKF
jgi:hypothetical protein